MSMVGAGSARPTCGTQSDAIDAQTLERVLGRHRARFMIDRGSIKRRLIDGHDDVVLFDQFRRIDGERCHERGGGFSREKGTRIPSSFNVPSGGHLFNQKYRFLQTFIRSLQLLVFG